MVVTNIFAGSEHRWLEGEFISFWDGGNLAGATLLMEEIPNNHLGCIKPL